MKIIRILSIILTLALLSALLAGCGTKNTENGTVGSGSAAGGSGGASGAAGSSDALPAASVKDAEAEKVEITSDFTITGNVTQSGNVYTITEAGTYTLSGKLTDGRITVNVPDDGEVTLVLSGASLSSSENAVIFATEAGKLTVKSEEGTYNEITDLRSAKTEDDDNQGAGAITAFCDLNITGKGSLVVVGSYNNGIHTKDDLKIKNVTLKVTAPNNALKGNDSVTVESGNLILISTGGDGIKTENTDISSKGNQRGTVSLEGGTIVIYAACDGIDASYDATVSDGVALSIMTANYSSYSGEITASSSTDLYLVVSSTVYSSGYRFAAYFTKSGSESGVWSEATYEMMVSERGSRTQYYALKLSAPSGYTNATFYRFASGSANSTSDYNAKTASVGVNTSMNAYRIKSVSSGTMTGDWVNLSTGSGGGPGGPGGGQGNTAKTAYSSKGIKAGNSISVTGGTIAISAMDDGLHANYGETLENGSRAEGNVTVSGGVIEILSADDGIHADNILTIEGGTVTVTKSYEGLEGNTVNIKGGTVTVTASDDGVNAAKTGAASTPSINVSGGTLTVTTASGDTDGIDSNGTYTQTGGFVLIMGGSSQGNVAGSLDADGSVKVTGGTIVALGGICELPASSSCPVVKMQRKSFAAGTYTLQTAAGDAIASFTLPSSYSSCWICSDGFTTGSSYKLTKDGSNFASWTQSSQTTAVN